MIDGDEITDVLLVKNSLIDKVEKHVPCHEQGADDKCRRDKREDLEYRRFSVRRSAINLSGFSLTEPTFEIRLLLLGQFCVFSVLGDGAAAGLDRSVSEHRRGVVSLLGCVASLQVARKPFPSGEVVELWAPLRRVSWYGLTSSGKVARGEARQDAYEVPLVDVDQGAGKGEETRNVEDELHEQTVGAVDGVLVPVPLHQADVHDDHVGVTAREENAQDTSAQFVVSRKERDHVDDTCCPAYQRLVVHVWGHRLGDFFSELC